MNSHYLGYIQSDSGSYLAYRDTTFVPPHSNLLVVRPTDGLAYLWNGTNWSLLGAPIWGKIKGSIGNQSDLMDSLHARQGVLIPAYGIRVSNDSVSIDSTHLPFVHAITRLTDSTLAVLVNGRIDTVLIRGTAAGGINSLVDTVPAILFINPVVYTNSGGAWRGKFRLQTQNPNTFFAGDSSGSADTPRFRHLALADLPVGIPNGNLANSSITFVIDNVGTSPGWSTYTPISLGSSITLHLPFASAASAGILSAQDWSRFNSASAPVTSVNGQLGAVNIGNADSLLGYPIDFTNFHDNWLLAGDSTHNIIKFVSPASSGFDSSSSQGGGFHTQIYNDGRYLFRTDSGASNPKNFTTQASRQKLSDSIAVNIAKKQTDLIWLPITYYLAIADSGMTDNTAAIQACVDSVTRSTSKKGVIYIPPGVFALSGTVHIPVGDQITFQGAGGSVGELSNAISKLVTNRTTGDVILDSANNSIFRGFDIQNNAGSPTAGAAIHMVGWFAKIENMAIANFYYDIELDNSLYDYVSKVSLLEAVQYSLYDNNATLADWGDATIESCLFQSGTGPIQHATVAAIYFPNSGGPKIFGNKFNGSSSGIQTCIRGNLVGSANSTSDLLVTGNSFEGFSQYALWITCPGANFSNIAFNGNEIAGFGSGNGILLDGTSGGLHRIAISGNTFNSLDTAIQAYHVDQLKISGNSIDSSSSGTVSYKLVTTFCTNCVFDDWNSGGGSGITALTGDIAASGTGSVAATIQAGTVSNAKLATVGANTFKGAISAGNPVDLTPSQAMGILGAASQTALNDSMAGIRTATSIFPRQGLSPYGSSTTDTIALGGIIGAFLAPDTLYTNGQPFLITGLPHKSSAAGTDSVLLSDANGKLWKLPVPSGGSGIAQIFGKGVISVFGTDTVAIRDSTSNLFIASPTNVTGAFTARKIDPLDLPAGIPLSKISITPVFPITISGGNVGLDTNTNNNSAASRAYVQSLLNKDTTIYVTGATGATYTNTALIGKQIVNLSIAGVNIPLTAPTGTYTYATFNASTGAFTLTNGSFSSDDMMQITYVTGATVFTGGGGAGGYTHSYQYYTSGSTVTVTNGVDILDVNPATTVSSLAVTLPATPNSDNEVSIYIGGTITSGTVVSTLTLSPGGGQSILGTTSFSVAVNDNITLQYFPTQSMWKRKN